MRLLKKTVAVFLFSGVLLNVNAETIVPDRPGFSTGTYTVQPKKLNVEIGYNYTKNDQTLPLMVLRTGVTNKLELDVMYDGLDIKHNDQKEYTWSSDLIIGAKYRVYESELYNITLMGLSSLPVDSTHNLSFKNMTPLAAVLWDYTFSENIGLFGTLQGSTYYDNERIYDFQPAVGASFTHTDKLGSYIELYSVIPSSSTQDTQKIIDGGFTYLINDDIQIDLNGGIGLNQESDDFVGFGVAIQF